MLMSDLSRMETPSSTFALDYDDGLSFLLCSQPLKSMHLPSLLLLAIVDPPQPGLLEAQELFEFALILSYQI